MKRRLIPDQQLREELAGHHIPLIIPAKKYQWSIFMDSRGKLQFIWCYLKSLASAQLPIKFAKASCWNPPTTVIYNNGISHNGNWLSLYDRSKQIRAKQITYSPEAYLTIQTHAWLESLIQVSVWDVYPGEGYPFLVLTENGDWYSTMLLCSSST